MINPKQASQVKKDNVIIGQKTHPYTLTIKNENDIKSFAKYSIDGKKVINCNLTQEEVDELKKDSRIDLKQVVPSKITPLGFPSDSENLKPIDFKKKISSEELKAQSVDIVGKIIGLPDGSDVDVVIVDEFADPLSPEFAVNADGSGGSRLNLIDWYAELGFSHSSYSSYPYGEIGDHGMHTMGTSCGNTQGWASKANIYNISPFESDLLWDNLQNKDLYIQAIKAWHENKPINPSHGDKNPTITNHSYGSFYPWLIDIRNILYLNYRGQTFSAPRNYSGAQFSASISGGGVSSINIINQGSNYTNPPTISFSGGGQLEANVELAQGSVYKVVITDGGSGYTKNNPPTITFSAPPAGGVQAQGKIVSDRWLDEYGNPWVYVNENQNDFYNIGPAGNGQIYFIEMTERGSGYVLPPTITFSNPGPGGRVAQATTEIKSNFLKKINITNGGTGHNNDRSIPMVVLSGGSPTEHATIAIGPMKDKFSENGSIINGVYAIDEMWMLPTGEYGNLEIWCEGGGSYQSVPQVSFINNGSDKLAQAYAVLGGGIDEGKITSVIIEKQGIGYTSAPSVVVTNGGGFKYQDLLSYGLVVYNDPYYEGMKVLANLPVSNPPAEQDFQELMQSGVVVTCAAGNSYYKIDNPDGQDYNNFIAFSFHSGINEEPSIPTSDRIIYSIYYNQGSTPGNIPGVLCVGAAGIDEYKSSFSNTGPRVDVYAPGSYINSSTKTEGLSDPRNGNYKITKWSGTSMASPQICGMLACHAKTNRNINQTSAVNFIKENAKPTLNEGTGYKNLQGGANKYAYFPDINHITE